MGLTPSLTNLFQFIGTLTPILVSFFFLGASVINQNIKGLIYIGGILIAYFINIGLQSILSIKRPDDASFVCGIYDLGITSNVSTPNWSSVFIMFTLGYIFLPMNYANTINYPIVIALLALFAIDATSVLANKCSGFMGVVLGGLFGALLGSLWYGIIKSTGNSKLLYFEETTNGETCSRPDKQTFKCAVYKNGKVIKNL